MIETTTVYTGEKKRIRCVVEALNQAPFEVSSASFELRHNDEVEASGPCEIAPVSPDTVVLSALIQPMIAKTTYTLVFYYDIYPERLQYFCKVRTVL